MMAWMSPVRCYNCNYDNYNDKTSWSYKVELVHGDDLGVSSPSSSPLDAECWSLAWLPHTGEHVLLQLGADSLDQANGGGGLPLPERCGSDAGHTHISPGLPAGQSLQGAQRHLGFLLPVQIHF